MSVTLTEFDIVPGEPFRIVTFARMTNGRPGGAARVLHNGNLIVASTTRGPMGYPVAPEDDIGISPHCGIYRGQGPDEPTKPIVYPIKMKNYYADRSWTGSARPSDRRAVRSCARPVRGR